MSEPWESLHLEIDHMVESLNQRSIMYNQHQIDIENNIVEILVEVCFNESFDISYTLVWKHIEDEELSNNQYRFALSDIGISPFFDLMMKDMEKRIDHIDTKINYHFNLLQSYTDSGHYHEEFNYNHHLEMISDLENDSWHIENDISDRLDDLYAICYLQTILLIKEFHKEHAFKRRKHLISLYAERLV